MYTSHPSGTLRLHVYQFDGEKTEINNLNLNYIPFGVLRRIYRDIVEKNKKLYTSKLN